MSTAPLSGFGLSFLVLALPALAHHGVAPHYDDSKQITIDGTVAEFQFIDFISCGFDMLTNYAAKSRYRGCGGIQAVFRGPCGSGVRGGPFHSINAEAFFLNTAGLKIVEPSEGPAEAIVNFPPVV